MAPNDHDEKYQRYIDNKLHEQGYAQARWKTREQWAAAVDFWKRSRDKGDRFQDGMMLLRNQTPTFGYDTEVRVRTPIGDRIQDSRHRISGDSSEYKAGAVTRDKALPQMDKDERIMQAGHNVDWTVVKGARIDKESQARMAELQRDYPDQFRVYVVSQQVSRLALTIGKHKEKERQREAQAQRKEAKELAARERERLAPKRLAERRNELSKQAQVIQQGLDQAKGKSAADLDAQKLAAAAKDLRREARKVEREGARQAEKLVTGLRMSEHDTREMQAHLAEKRAEKTAPVRDTIAALGAKAREVEAAEKQAALDKQATLEREQLKERDQKFKEQQERQRADREALGLSQVQQHVLEASNVAPSQQMTPEQSAQIRRLKTDREGRGLSREIGGRER